MTLIAVLLLCSVFLREGPVEAAQPQQQRRRESESRDPLSSLDKFILCDLSRDQLVSPAEFKDCARFPSSTNQEGALEEIYRHFDADQDGHLSKREFELFFETISSKEREVEVVTSDGTRKTMRQGDFLKMEEERRKGFQYENGQVSKVNEGSSEIDNLREENPELSRFVTIGRWAHHCILQLGYASGNITGLRSIDDMNSEDSAVERGDRDYFEMKVELSMKESHKPKAKNATFEVWVAWDPANYLPPYLVMKSLTRVEITKSGEVTRTALECAQSRRRQWPFTTLYFLARFFSQWTVPLVIFCISSLLVLSALYLFSSPTDSEQGEEFRERKIKKA